MSAIVKTAARVERRLEREAAGMGGLTVGARCDETGFPARIVLLPGGRAAFLHCRLPGGVPTPREGEWLRRLRGLGFGAAVYDGTRSLSDCMAPGR